MNILRFTAESLKGENGERASGSNLHETAMALPNSGQSDGSLPLNTFAGPLPATTEPFEYDPSTLIWNDVHTANQQGKYCYCGKDRILDQLMLCCDGCKNWFHVSCLKQPLGPTVPFLLNYHFLCQGCIPKRTLPQYQFARASTAVEAPEPLELHEWTTASWKNILTTTIANLSLQRMKEDATPGEPINPIIPDSPRYTFGKHDTILPFIDSNWGILCKNRTRTPTWQTTVGSRLYEERDAFKVPNEEGRSAISPYTIHERNLLNLRPGFVNIVAPRPSFPSDQRAKAASSSRSVPRAPKAPKPSRAVKALKPAKTRVIKSEGASANFSSSAPAPHLLTEISTQKAKKRRFERGIEDTTISQNSDSGSQSVYIPSYSDLVQLYPPPPSPGLVDHPCNAEGYKYDFATPTPNKPFTDNVRLLSAFQARGEGVWWSASDRSPQISVNKEGRSATNEGGFRTVRATHGVKEGCWYFEIMVDRGGGEGKTSPEANDGAHVRVGWSRREGAINAPVGYDSYSYGIRDATGEKIHEAQTTAYGESFQTGDVIGCLINLPRFSRPQHNYRPTDPKNRTIMPSSFVPLRRASTSREESSNQVLVPSIANIPWESMSTVGHPRQRSVIRYKGSLVFESGEFQPINRPPILYHISNSRPKAAQKYPTVVDKAPPWHSKITSTSFPPLIGSYIRFFKNGRDMGPAPAFSDLPMPIPAAAFLPSDKNDKPLEAHWPTPPFMDDGTYGYYPAVSLFRGGTVTANFGPSFRFPPPSDSGWKPMSDRFLEREVEECMWDILDEMEATFYYAALNARTELAKAQSRNTSGTSTPDQVPSVGLAESNANQQAQQGSVQLTAQYPGLKIEEATDFDTDVVMERVASGDVAGTETSSEFPDGQSQVGSVAELTGAEPEALPIGDVGTVDEELDDASDGSDGESQLMDEDASQKTSRDALSDDSETDTQMLEASFIKGLHSGPGHN
ncbi:hypothetical protein M427DRAFT_133939 [Gonapodya prolifera JEL478]|uniref:B30.2/SPRY domain-containing protein n=1 Tax=Gonapodya prolifera (strain JEL478) TaxID=1344416 RepID=A0A139AJC4_GONPJ|nr:hypothetical protein M427DRAFT_133939 [Gonapodya prolifera JEL478]|eukprot:KXS16563.1 hypothetical protein M427DRAFT_133939 [Gonapodya prolifera JEL478]